MHAARKLEPTEKPKTQKFSLRTPYMKQGRITQLVAETENMWIHTKINYEGGENEIHCHLDEDHSFIVLEGQMSVFDENGNEITSNDDSTSWSGVNSLESRMAFTAT